MFLCSLVLAFIAVLAMRNSQPASPGPAASPREVRELLEAQAVAWNQGDLEGFMVGYWQSPELSFYSGKDKKHGWQETIERYRTRYQAEGREMGKLAFSELEIEMVGADLAWVRGRWEVVTSKEKLNGLFTLVCRKLPEGWRIVHDHTSGG